MLDNVKVLKITSFFTICVLIALSLFLSSQRGLTSGMEAESAQTAREFLMTKDWTINHLNGEPDYDKPPLFFWIIALFSYFAGSVNELATRLPSILSVILIMVLFRRLAHEEESTIFAFASVIFISSPQIFWTSQVARMDMLLTLFCFAAIVCFVLYWEETNKKKKALYYYLYFVAAALGVMTKGPVGFVLPAMPVFIFLLMKKQFGELRKFFLGSGILVFLAVALPWYIIASIKTEGRFFYYFILEENLSRFGNLFKFIEFEEYKKRPIYEYLVFFLVGFFPWSLLFPFFIYDFFKHKRDFQESDLILFVYVLSIFIFFSMMGQKRNYYILPLYPAASYLLGRYLLKQMSFTAIRRIIISVCIFIGISTLLAAALPPLLSGEINGSVISQYISKSHLADVEFYMRYGNKIIYLSIILCVAVIGVFIYGILKNDKYSLYSALILVLTSVFLYTYLAVYPVVDVQKDMRPYYDVINRIVDKDQLYAYYRRDDQAVFYLNRFIKEISEDQFLHIMKEKDRQVFILIEEKYYHRFLEKGVNIPFVYNKSMPRHFRFYLISNTPVNPDKLSQHG
ncbi:MAG: glycosyltransferase family 39 protein [Syntrophobacterales bacterium]|jgi:4-amino-4-deoxy-L-arabinose transferase-like glycosyltransferase